MRKATDRRVRQAMPAGLAALASLACALLASASPARADGLAPVSRALAGPVDVTVLASPAPVQVGLTTWYVLLGETGDDGSARAQPSELVLAPDARAGEPQTPPRVVPLTPVGGSGRLWSGSTELAHPGHWRGRARLQSAAGATLEMTFEIEAVPGKSPLLEHWRALSIAPVGLAGFGLHQWLCGRRRRRHRSR